MKCAKQSGRNKVRNACRRIICKALCHFISLSLALFTWRATSLEINERRTTEGTGVCVCVSMNHVENCCCRSMLGSQEKLFSGARRVRSSLGAFISSHSLCSFVHLFMLYAESVCEFFLITGTCGRAFLYKNVC
jgi:hypothetical protein